MLVAPASKGEAEAIILYALRGDTYAEHRTIVVSASSLSLTDDARVLAFIRDRRSVQLLNTSDGRDITPPPLRDTLREIIDPYELSLSPNGRFLAMVSIPSDRTEGQSLAVVETRSGKKVAGGSHMNRINKFVFSANEKYLATAGQDNDGQIFYLSETKKPATLHLSRPVKEAIFDSQSKTLALVSDDGSSIGSSVSIFDVSSARETTRLQHRQLVRALGFSRDGKYLVTSSSVVEPDRQDQSERHRLIVWTLETNELLAEAERRIKALPVAINRGHVGLPTVEEGPLP
jgi:WD40 repeat protein